MKKPIIIINLKTYKQGKEVIKLAKQISKIDKNIIIGVQPTDIYEINKAVNNPVYSQHVDFQKPGKNTGFILPEAVKVDGARGVFLNHSEHKLKFKVLKQTVERCSELGLKTLIFANGIKEAKKIKKLAPDYIIIEPPELVGGKVSVSKAHPGLIKKIKEKLGYPFIVGAGIKTNNDLEIAMKLGAKGIALSSGITKVRDPVKKLKQLIGK